MENEEEEEKKRIVCLFFHQRNRTNTVRWVAVTFFRLNTDAHTFMYQYKMG